jgi:hypothetical protein
MTTEAKELFCDGDKVAIVLDGTYIYIQKSSNYAFQRQSFSGHKHRPLLKPFMIVSPDGCIIDVKGPFQANINDATISRHIGEELRSVLEVGDVILADRGFVNAAEHLAGLGLDVRLPESNSGQLTVEQANRTRLVTKCRYIVETRIGHIKQCFRCFDKVWPNHSILHLMEDFRIACAILNAFHPVIETDSGDANIIAETMLARMGTRNHLGEVVAAQNLNRRSASFQSIDGNTLEDFPQLTETDLRSLTLGSYQLRQARSYYAEHIKTNGRYEIAVCKHIGPLSLTSHGLSVEDPMLVRGRIQSRHRGSTRHFIYILIDRLSNGADSVSGYCCSCQSGLRTVGCCAHVATVLWYLGYGQYQSEILIPASFLDDCVESVDIEQQ